MMIEIKELPVAEYDRGKKVMYFAKELLCSNEKLNLVANTNSAAVASRAAETLARLGYVTFDGIKTLTEIKNGRRAIKLFITLKKTANFQKLYDENQEFKKQKEAERQKEAKETKK